MRILVSAWAWLVMILGLALHVGMTQLGMLVMRATPQQAAWCARTARYFLMGMFWLSRIRVVVRGLDNAMNAHPVLILANHCSHADIIALLRTLPIHSVFVAKQELFRVPLLAHELRSHGHMAINRANPRKSLTVLNGIVDQLALGRSVVVFPEGTRSPDGTLQPFHRAVFSVAFKHNIPILPVTIQGSTSVLSKDSLIIQPGTIELDIHSVIQPNQADTVDDLMAQVRASIGLHP